MIQERINAYFDDKALEAELVNAVSRLIAIDSTKGEPATGRPFGEGPEKALEEALNISASFGLPGENLEGYVGVVDLNQEETALHILTHLDVVAAGTGWQITKPFTPLYQDGLLYGRGAEDNKGPAIAALFALRAVRDLGVPLRKNARLLFGTDEESGFGDIKWYYERHPFAPHSFAPDAAFPLTNTEKGHFKPNITAEWPLESTTPRVTEMTGSAQINVIPPKATATILGMTEKTAMPFVRKVALSLDVDFSLTQAGESLYILCSGTGAHASTPELGNNALTALLTLLTKLPLADCASTRAIRGLAACFPHGDHTGKPLDIAQADDLAGALTIALTMIRLSAIGFSAQADGRTPLCATEESCRSAVEAKLAMHGLKLRRAYYNPPHHTPADSPFVQTLLKCYEQYTDDVGMCLSTGGGTYVHNIPGGVAFGATMPGFFGHLHGPDERMSVPDLLTAAKIFTQAIIDLCG